MEKKALRICLVLLSVVLVFTSFAVVIASATDEASAEATTAHSDYTPKLMFSNNYQSVVGSATSDKEYNEFLLIRHSTEDDGDRYLLHRPGLTSDSYPIHTYTDIWTGSHTSTSTGFINLKSFTNDSGTELTSSCSTKYVVYDFDFGTETDISDGWSFEIISRKIKSSSSISVDDQSVAGSIQILFADDEETGNLQLKVGENNYIDTGLSIDNKFVHFTVVLDLNEVISSNDSSKAVAYFYLNGKNTGLSATGFSANANYFDMVRFGFLNGATKITDSVILDNFTARSFSTDYNGNLGHIISDSSNDISKFDCTIYDSSYQFSRVRPLAKIGIQAANTHKDICETAKNGDVIRYLRPQNYYLPSSIANVTEYYSTSSYGAQSDGTLFAIFDENGSLIKNYSSTANNGYHKALSDATASRSFAYVEIYANITVARAGSSDTNKDNLWKAYTVSLNGNKITFDATNSARHFIEATWGAAATTPITYYGPGTIASNTSSKNIVYLAHDCPDSIVNIEDISIETPGNALNVRRGTVTFKNCNLEWWSNSCFAFVQGVKAGTASPNLNVIDSTVIDWKSDTNEWRNFIYVSDFKRNETDYYPEIRSVFTFENSELQLNGASLIRTATDGKAAEADVKPIVNILNSTVTSCRTIVTLPTSGATVPTVNISNSEIAQPQIGFSANGSSCVFNFENSIFGVSPKDIKGTVSYSNGNKLFASTNGYFVVTKPEVKANMSLNSDFNFNFYIPKDSFVSVSGESVAVGDDVVIGGKTYAQVAYEGIAPSVAGTAATVPVQMTFMGCTYTANFSVSIPKYIERVHAKAEAGYQDSVRAVPLMAAIVNYIDNAYVYFGKSEGSDNIAILKTLLADEIEALEPSEVVDAVNTMTNVSHAIASARMVLDSVPKVRFNVEEGYNGTITVNGIAYPVADGKYEENTYIDVNMRARHLSNVLTVTADGKNGQYNVAAYYNYLNNQPDQANAVTLLDALYIYGEKAKEYVAHVYATVYSYDENYHWNICTDSSCQSSSAKTEHNFGNDYYCDDCGYEYIPEETTGNFINSLGISETTMTDRDDMKFAKILDNSRASYTFTDEDKSAASAGDVLLFSFVVKAKDASVPLNIKADLGTVINKNPNEDSKSMTYYVPVQWTRIYMPIKNNGMKDITLETDGTVYIAEAKFENCGNVPISSLSLKSGMWMIDDFEKIAVKETMSSDANFKWPAALELSKDGKYLYSIQYGNNGTFSITNLEDGISKHITDVGDEIRQLAITEDGKYAIITARSSGACIIDIALSDEEKAQGITTPAPEIVSSYNTVELATGLYVSGNYAFITNRYHGVEVVDITDPANPVQKANIYTGGEVQSCVVYKNILYCGVWGELGVYMYDLTELETATSDIAMKGKVVCNGKGDGLTVTEIGGRIYVFAATGHHSYAAGFDTDTELSHQNLPYGQGNGMDIFDVTDPSNPKHVSTSKIDGRYYYSLHDFWETEVSYANGKYYAYLVNTYNGVYVYDVTDPEAPVRLAHITVPVSPTALTHASRAVLTSWDQTKEGRSPIGSIAVKDGIAYIGGINTSIHVYRNSSLFYEHTANEGTSVRDLDINGFYSSLDTGLNNGYTFWHENNGQVLSVATTDKCIYLAAGSEGIIVLNKENYKKIQTITPQKVGGRVGFASSIEIKGDKLYCAEDVAGLGVYTIKADGTLEEIKDLGYRNSSQIISQVRLSPYGTYAVVQINSNMYGIVQFDYEAGTSNIITTDKLDTINGNMYHRNLSELINGRYILVWNHLGSMCWIDFDPQSGADSAPTCKLTTDKYMATMTNGIAAYGDKALFVGLNNYRLYSDIGSNTGNYADASNREFSGKPTVCGNYLVVTKHDSGMIYIVDISNVDNPKVIHVINVLGNPDIAYYDDNGTVYIPLGNQGLLTINLNAAFAAE